ncbi:MAG: hypothetical protein K6F07_01800, partial [Bacilli bacterium]|nr:hypothetical protein [Bacilli bacterium]
MKKLSYVMLTPLLIAALSGCGGKSNSAQDIVNAVAKDASLLLNTEGAPVYADTTTQMYAGDFFLALNKFEYNEKTTVDITWT